jgi:hypothetical protein
VGKDIGIDLLVLWTSSILDDLHGKKIMIIIWVELLPSTKCNCVTSEFDIPLQGYFVY